MLQCRLSSVHKAYLRVNGEVRSFLLFLGPKVHFDTLLKPLRDRGSGNESLMVACTFVSEDLEAVQDGLSLPDSNRVHLFHVEGQTLIQVQDLILSEK